LFIISEQCKQEEGTAKNRSFPSLGKGNENALANGADDDDDGGGSVTKENVCGFVEMEHHSS
jgi:hypothetical protein